MKVPTKFELTHLQLQAMLREHSITEDQMKYICEREYTADFKGHPEYHGQTMPWYLIGGEHEVPVCDIASVDRVDEE